MMTPKMAPVLEVIALQKSYGGLIATNNVSLSVAENEFHALIGPNGAGKTTIISQLFGEVMSDSGTIRLDGRDVTSLPTHRRVRRGMARSFQVTTLVQDLSVLDNMILAIQSQDGHAFHFFRKFSKDKSLVSRAMNALDAVGLKARAQEEVSNLSHGEQRLLELGLALSGKPKLLLLDEPMAGLGPEEGRAMTEFLRKVKGSTTVVLVEHDMDTVFDLADRITVLVRGTVVASDAPAAIRQNEMVREAYLGEDG